MASDHKNQDFTGYWVLSRIENFDEFLRALGFPWVVRKAALKFGSNAVDIIAHTGTSMKVTTLNAKGSWTRTYNTEQAIHQPNVEGVQCKTISNWEGMVFHTRIEGSALGPCETWRYRRGDVMVVKTTVKPPRAAETSVYWFFERMQALQLQTTGSKPSHLLKQIAKDQKRVFEATQRDNAYLQTLLTNWERWSSPADEFIKVSSPKSQNSSHQNLSSLQTAGSIGGGGGSSRRHLPHRPPSALTSPQSMSKTPSTTSLSNLATAGTVSAHDSRIDLSSVPSEAGSGAGGNVLAQHPSSLTTAGSATSIPHVIPSLPLGIGRKVTSSENLHNLHNAASGNVGGAGTPRRPAHYRSPSADSIPGTGSESRATPHSPSKGTVPTGGEALMAYKMHEFLDGRGIMAVVPVTTPNDTSEPQLLEMSPEQAEETAAKLRELETDMLLRRQEHARGFICCGLVISKEKYSLPEHLRVWEMTLA